MNLSATEVKAVKSSTPQIVRTPSHRSSSASDEYFSEYASDASSTKSQLNGAHYETPPSRVSTPPLHNHPVMDSEMTLPARPIAAARPPQPPLNVRLNQARATRDEQLSRATGLDNDIMSPPTPGIDDTPYIRFAIEQLTRDEELLGHGRHGSVTSNEYPIERTIPDEGLGYYHPPGPVSQPPRPPGQPSESGSFENNKVTDEILLPVAPPQGTQWSNLQYVPTILRLPLLLLLVLICLLITAGLIFSNIHALRSKGFYDYDGVGTARYFVFQFLPQLVGIIIILWLFAIQAAIYRVLPYFVMSMDKPRGRVLQGLHILPANFLFPDLSFFNKGDVGGGLVLLVFWLTNFTVPLLSCFYQTKWITNGSASRWRWTSVQSVGWMLVTLYIMLTMALIYCIFRFRRRNSALMWDPTSLADLIPIFRQSNILGDFERSEVSGPMRAHLPPKFLRLGYWTSSKGSEIFHTVGEEGASYKRLSTPRFAINEKPNEPKNSDSFDVERHRYSNASSFTHDIHSQLVRYRWVPWFLSRSAVLAWQILAIILLLAFLIVSFVNRAIIRGFLPFLPSGTNLEGFSSSDFLYSFLPSLFGMFLFLAWQPIDTFFRAVQPFANLSNPAGATAEHSLLLSYPNRIPVDVTIRALLNRDLRVAWTSFISLMSLTIPVLAGGVFTAQLFASDNNTIRISATMPAYYALCVFLAIYAFSFLAIWPTRQRHLPHSIRTIADQLSFVYQSPLLTDAAFRNVSTKTDLVRRLVVALTGDGARVPKYGFGIYLGRDGKEHLGIDRLQRPGSGEMLITSGFRR